MRILVTLPSLEDRYGGPVTKGRALQRALRRRGHDVRLLGVGETHDGDVALGRLARFHATPIPRRVRPVTDAVRAADIVHVIGFRDPVGTVAALAARRAEVPYVFEPAGMYHHDARSRRIKRGFDVLVGRRVQEGAAVVVATSRHESDALIALGISPKRVAVRFNGVELPAKPAGVERSTARARWGFSDDVVVVAAVGRLNPKKQLPMLVEALSEIPGTVALIVGPDEGDYGAVMRAVAAHHMADRAIIEPAGLFGGAKWWAYEAADVFCLPSLDENFGTAIGEAAVAGLPVVISDQCGIREVLDPQTTTLVRAGDREALCAGLRSVIERRQPVAEAARRGASRLEAALDWTVIAEQQEAIYDLALAHHGEASDRAPR